MTFEVMPDTEQMILGNVYCDRCKDYKRALLVRVVSTSGVSMPFWLCLTCQKGAKVPRKWLSRAETQGLGVDPQSLPVWSEYDRNPPRCAVCGREGAEWHHWAPRAVFADAEDWPKSYLCPLHHRQWHDAMVGYTNGGDNGNGHPNKVPGNPLSGSDHLL